MTTCQTCSGTYPSASDGAYDRHCDSVTHRGAARPDLTAEAERRFPASNPNHKWHRSEHIRYIIATAERAAYAEEDRRTIRVRYLAAIEASNEVSLFGSPSEPDFDLLELVEADELISPAELLATVPDRYGRISAFAVSVQTATSSFTSRNLRLSAAVKYAQSQLARGHRASVHVDSCG